MTLCKAINKTLYFVDVLKNNDSLEDLVQLKIEFRHKSDWTKGTVNKPFIFKSLRWFSILDSRNVEMLLSKCISGKNKIPPFMNKMVVNQRLFRIVDELKISPNVQLHVVTGPFVNTVRSILSHNRSVFSDSIIKNGLQIWTVMLQKSNLENLISDMKEIGEIQSITTSDSFEAREKMIFFPNSNLDLDVLKLLLGESEYRIIESAIKMGLFLDQRKITLTELAKLHSKTKSTVSRQYHSALNKIMKLVTYNIGIEAIIREI